MLTLDRFGRIDGLVNNAAYYTAITKKDFTELSTEEWNRCFAVNVRGAWLCARAVTPAMKERRRGKTVNVSSMTVPTARPGFAHYISSKAAIVGLTRALAREHGEYRVCVNTLTSVYSGDGGDFLGLCNERGLDATPLGEAVDQRGKKKGCIWPLTASSSPSRYRL